MIARLRFESGFFQTASAEAQRTIEQSCDYGLTIRDVTEIIRGEMPLTEEKRVYFSSDPELAIEHQVRFCAVAEGLGVFSADNPVPQWLIERSPSFNNRDDSGGS